MAQYQYTGLDPEEAPDGSGLARPLDIREFGEDPDWGAWELIPEDAESDAEPPAASAPAAPAVTPPAAVTAPAATTATGTDG